MLPHQLRAIDEKAELDKKIQALRLFATSSNPIFKGLEREEKYRLLRQMHYMILYSEVLGKRIAAFK